MKPTKMFVFTRQIMENLVSKPVTEEYPFKQSNYAERMRGHIEIDIEQCISCTLCAQNCPPGAIQVDRQKGTPLQCSLLLFILTAAATIYGIRRRTGLWGIDLVLFGMAGIVGCVLAFLALFSQHPAVSSNFLLLVFHPGQLLFLPYIVYCVVRTGLQRVRQCPHGEQ